MWIWVWAWDLRMDLDLDLDLGVHLDLDKKTCIAKGLAGLWKRTFGVKRKKNQKALKRALRDYTRLLPKPGCKGIGSRQISLNIYIVYHK